MARLTFEANAPQPPQDGLENQIQQVGTLLLVACTACVTVVPGAILGAAGAALWQWLGRPALWVRLAAAAMLATPLLFLRQLVVVGWLWRDVVAHLSGAGTVITGTAVVRSVCAEILAGPLLLEATLLAWGLTRRRVSARVRRDHRLDRQRWRAISGRRQLKAMLPDPNTAETGRSPDHPPGHIRLGLDRETQRHFDLAVPSEIAGHVFLPGATGSGKTTTLTRLADGALSNWYGVVIVDCKGGDLGATARMLADRYGLPFHLVDPDDPDTLGYNPCSGDAAAVSNKLVGAFSYGPAAEIYKNIAMEAIPVMVRGLAAAGSEVTLDALYDACGPRGLVKIAQRINDPEDRAYRRLVQLSGGGDEDDVGTKGYRGLQHRFGALLEGKFGDLFRAREMLDWDAALAEPSVTYIALSALASSEDVELMGRVIAQDLKQACARRIRARANGADVTPVLAIFDEFAALDEADQLAALLLQARQALMPTVISTQYIPETVALKKAVLGAGLLVCHRLEAEDAEAIAAQFGTRSKTEVTHQTDFNTGFSERGSFRTVDAYNVHPNELRDFQTGYVAVRSAAGGRHGIVQVHRDTG